MVNRLSVMTCLAVPPQYTIIYIYTACICSPSHDYITTETSSLRGMALPYIGPWQQGGMICVNEIRKSTMLCHQTSFGEFCALSPETLAFSPQLLSTVHWELNASKVKLAVYPYRCWLGRVTLLGLSYLSCVESSWQEDHQNDGGWANDTAIETRSYITHHSQYR